MARSVNHEGFKIAGIERIPSGGQLRGFLTSEFQRFTQSTNIIDRAARFAIDHDLVIKAIPDPKIRLLALVFFTSQEFLLRTRRLGGDPQVKVFTEFGFTPDLQDAADQTTSTIRLSSKWRTFLDVTNAYRAKILEQQELEAQRQEAERRLRGEQERRSRLEIIKQLEFDALRLRNATAAPESLVFPEANLDQRERRAKLIALRRTPIGVNMSSREVAQALHVSVPTITIDQREIDRIYPGAIPPRHHGRKFGLTEITVTHKDAIMETIARLEAEHGPWKYGSVTYKMVGAELGLSEHTVKKIVLKNIGPDDDLDLPHQDRGAIHQAVIHDAHVLMDKGKPIEEIIAHFRGYGISERQVRMAMGEKL